MPKDIKIIANWDDNELAFKPKFKDLTRRLMSGRLKDDQALVLIHVKPYREKRTIEQNALYWGVVMRIVLDFHKETTGETVTPEQMHFFICTQVAGIQPEMVTVFGVTYWKPTRTRTSEMSKQEFSEFIETVRLFFQERGCDFSELDNYENLKSGT